MDARSDRATRRSATRRAALRLGVARASWPVRATTSPTTRSQHFKLHVVPYKYRYEEYDYILLNIYIMFESLQFQNPDFREVIANWQYCTHKIGSARWVPTKVHRKLLASNTICSVSTSFATSPYFWRFSIYECFKAIGNYLYDDWYDEYSNHVRYVKLRVYICRTT